MYFLFGMAGLPLDRTAVCRASIVEFSRAISDENRPDRCRAVAVRHAAFQSGRVVHDSGNHQVQGALASPPGAAAIRGFMFAGNFACTLTALRLGASGSTAVLASVDAFLLRAQTDAGGNGRTGDARHAGDRRARSVAATGEQPAPLEATGMALIRTALAMLAWSPHSNAPP